MYWYQTNKFKYAIVGALFGIGFPVIAVFIDILRLGLPISWQSLVQVQSTYPIHYIIDTAPLFLGLFALLGGIKQDRILAINKQLEKDFAEKQEALRQLQQTTKEKQRLEGELSVASEIQQSLLPKISIQQGVDISARLIPALEIGGDFYDFFFIDEERICLVMADVSGKGVPAALMMAVCKTLIKSTAHIDASPANICTHVNNEIARENSNFMFISAFVGVLNLKTRDMAYTNAGHCPTYIKKANGAIQKLSEVHGVVLGAMEGIQYKESYMRLEKEDFVFAYTDGITEAHNAAGDLFSDKRLAELLGDSRASTPEELLKEVIGQVQNFENTAAPFDDITALALRISPRQKSANYV